MIKVHLNNNDRYYVIEGKMNLGEFLEFSEYKPDNPVLAAKVNNRIRELNSEIYTDSDIEYITVENSDGVRIIQRGLIFLLYLSAKKLFPEKKLKVLHSLNNGLYCELGNWISEDDLNNLKHEMEELIKSDFEFKKIKLDKREAIEKFREQEAEDKLKIFRFRTKSTVSVYKCGNIPLINYFYGYMPPSSGVLKVFDLKLYGQGFLLLCPTPTSPDKLPEYKDMQKFSQVFLQYQRWGEILGIETVGDLNKKIAENRIKEIILISEALHEKKIAKIAEEISKYQNKRLLLIAGPSSSGKTTTAKRLQLQLKANCINPVSISIDDYFIDREKTPKDENGNYDFESIDAINLELFNKNISDLMDGKEVYLPRYDFKTGKSTITERKICIKKDQPIIVEGIHGLNEKLSEKISRKNKFKIYVSALTQLGIDDINRIPTTDTRLIRRIVRDSWSRGHNALRTIQMWPSVRRGEEKYIFPYQEEADIMFSSALVYELSVLRIYAEKLLVQISEEHKENSEAKRLLKFLEYFLPITDKEDIPRNSIIREFIGGSIFDY